MTMSGSGMGKPIPICTNVIMKEEAPSLLKDGNMEIQPLPLDGRGEVGLSDCYQGYPVKYESYQIWDEAPWALEQRKGKTVLP